MMGRAAALAFATPLALALSCAQAVTAEPPLSDLSGGPGTTMGDGPCGPPVTRYRYNIEATFLGNGSVMGLCVAEVYYCSETSTAADQLAPQGFVSAVSAPGGCDLNECKGRSCQQNFCKDCRGNCVLNCPR